MPNVTVKFSLTDEQASRLAEVLRAEGVILGDPLVRNFYATTNAPMQPRSLDAVTKKLYATSMTTFFLQRLKTEEEWKEWAGCIVP